VRLRRLVLVTASMAAVAVPAGDAAAAADVVVSVDRPAITTELGRRFVFRSTISNRGTAAATGLIAHLNVLSLRRGVYVDPEDWSSDRTRYLAPIGAGRSITLTWNLQAVNAGTIGVYVAAVERGSVRPATSPTVEVSIAQRRTLNSGGIVPLALGIPALLGGLAVGVHTRRRRPA
jgi:hypothetical protein